jgi:beta-galactosidase
MSEENEIPFVYGAQYYRAPTPYREHWAGDLKKIHELGFDTVKFWVQWRWSQRSENEYNWDDLDELMRLAEKEGLRVVLNLICDVMPAWAVKKYPDGLMVDYHGTPSPVSTTVCRQIGGYPGPCHAHEPLKRVRQAFFEAAIRHFKPFRALWSWDVWNEPERNLLTRKPDHVPEYCYCESCHAKFLQWLKTKYRDIDTLNRVWGRCNNDFDEVELPIDPNTVTDFIDWREFQASVLTEEAAWRLDAVRRLDPARLAHLHVVPATGCFSPLSCVDDFELGRKCEIFGATMAGGEPYSCAQAVSAADGKYFYNAEWHLNFGGNAMYQRIISRDVFSYDLLPQLGWGVRGFLFWQYRAEVLGTEAPAWGVVKTDGSDRPVTRIAAEFIQRFVPYKAAFMQCAPRRPVAVIYRSTHNEIYQFCRHGDIKRFNTTMQNYCRALYELNIPFVLADETLLRKMASEVKLLILPQIYYTRDSETALFEQLRQQGTLIFSEGNLAAYSADRGHFEYTVPGGGLAEKWGFRETDATSSFHLPPEENAAAEGTGAKGDVLKALEATGGSRGGEFFNIHGADEIAATGAGAVDFALLQCDDAETLATYRSLPIVIRKDNVYYAGTMLGYGAEHGKELLVALLKKAAKQAAIDYTENDLHLEPLCDANGVTRFIVAVNHGAEAQTLTLPAGNWHELYERPTDSIAPKSALFLIAGK